VDVELDRDELLDEVVVVVVEVVVVRVVVVDVVVVDVVVVVVGRVLVDKLDDVEVVVIATCVRISVLVQSTTPPSPVVQDDVGTVTLMLRSVEIVTPPGQVTMPPRPVEQDVTVVTLWTVVVEKLSEVRLGEVTEGSAVNEVEAPPKTPLKPAPSVPPTPPPAVADAPRPSPPDPVLTLMPSPRSTETDKLAASEPWRSKMVLDPEFTPKLPPAPAPTPPIMHPFRTSPPLVHVVTGTLPVVIPVLTETVALIEGMGEGVDEIPTPPPLVLIGMLKLGDVDGEA
jgi:hypothetical protein